MICSADSKNIYRRKKQCPNTVSPAFEFLLVSIFRCKPLIMIRNDMFDFKRIFRLRIHIIAVVWSNTYLLLCIAGNPGKHILDILLCEAVKAKLRKCSRRIIIQIIVLLFQLYKSINGEHSLDDNNWYEFIEFGTTNALTVFLQRKQSSAIPHIKLTIWLWTWLSIDFILRLSVACFATLIFIL